MNGHFGQNKERRKQYVNIAGLFVVVILILGIYFYQNVFAKGTGKESQSNRETPLILENTKNDIGLEQEEGNSVQEVQQDSSHIIKDFPIILQSPELPTGCEITALTMVLNYYGLPADKITMAEDYLPKADAGLYYGEDGLLYGNDLEQYFIGDPFSEAGITCGTQAIATAADEFLMQSGETKRARILKAVQPDGLYEFVSQDIPVMVWITISMDDRWETQGWYTETGSYVDWSQNDHGAVLVGYTESTVTIADPIAGLVEYSKEQFEHVYESRGENGLVIQ